MRRYRTMIKGSASELTWLNKLAAKGWLLTRVHGNWYDFEQTAAHYRIFSEYVPNELAPTLAAHEQVFKILATVPLTVAEVQVVYTGSSESDMQQPRVDRQDAPLQLKIALALRTHDLNVMNVFFFVGLVFIISAIFLTNDGIPDVVGEVILNSWLLIAVILAVRAIRVHFDVARLRRETQNYDGAWMPTKHVFLKHLAADLETEKIDSIGTWQLVGHDKKGFYWYDVRSLASDIEIRDAVKAIVPAETTVNVVGALGLAPIGYF